MDYRVMSFNVRCANDPNGHSIAERAPRVREILKKYDPDLLGVQEFRPVWEPYFGDYLALGYEMYYVPRDFNANREATPLLWKKELFECIEKKTFWLSDTPEEESRGWDEKYNVNRICSYVILKDKRNGKLLCFMNTHFGFGDHCQTSSAQLIYDYSKAVGDMPVLCTGDFNMRNDSAGYKKMSSLFADANAVTAKETITTFHGYDPEKHPKSHIDYCFVNEKVTPASFKVLTDMFDGKYPSDHYPILIELSV